MLQVLYDNFSFFDAFILIAFLIALVLFLWIRLYVRIRVEHIISPKSEKNKMAETIYGSAEGMDEVKTFSSEDLIKIHKDIKYINPFYSFFTNLISSFPMFGIMGTVTALLMMLSSTDNLQQNFFIALTSTFWGLFSAITLKMLDSIWLSSQMEYTNTYIQLAAGKEKMDKEKAEKGSLS